MVVTPQPVLVTERVELWQPTKEDRAAIHAIVSDPESGRFLGRGTALHEHFQRYARNAGSWWLYGYGGFILRLRASGAVIGNGGVFHSWRGLGEGFDDRPEAGWTLRHDLVGQGLAHEAVAAAIGWFERERGAQDIFCMISEGNDRSFALAERLGFARVREAQLPGGDAVIVLVRPANGLPPSAPA